MPAGISSLLSVPLAAYRSTRSSRGSLRIVARVCRQNHCNHADAVIYIQWCRPRQYIGRFFPRRAWEFFSATSAPLRPLRRKDQSKHPPDFARKHSVRLTGNTSRDDSSCPMSPLSRKPAPEDPANTICKPSKHRNLRFSATGVRQITDRNRFKRPPESSQFNTGVPDPP